MTRNTVAAILGPAVLGLAPLAVARAPDGGAKGIARPSGKTITVENDTDVRITDAKGQQESESFCGAPGYEAGSEFLARVQALVQKRDFEALSLLVQYPLGGGRTVPAGRNPVRGVVDSPPRPSGDVTCRVR